MIYAALNNVLDQITEPSRATRWSVLLEALLQLLSLWHVTGFCETTPNNLVPRITHSLTLCRAQCQRIGGGVRPSEIRDRWPPPANSVNQQQPEDLLIKLAIKLAYNLKKSHSSTDLARSVFWNYQFKTPTEEADHGINTYNPDVECPIRMTYNRMMTSFRLLRKSRVGSQLFDELRLKSDTLSEYKMSFNREIVEFHTAIELIRNHEESVICQPILGELWDRIFLRIQNFFTQLAIYQNIDKSWCSSMARMVGLYCHTILMIHARFGAILRILESSESLRFDQNEGNLIISDVEISEFHLTRGGSGGGGPPAGYTGTSGAPGGTTQQGGSPVALSRTPQSSASQDLSPGGRVNPSILEDEIGDLASSLLCMSPVAYSKVSKVIDKCKSAEDLAFLLGAVEMWPDGSIPTNDTTANIIKGVETGRQWLEQRHHNSINNDHTVVTNTVFLDTHSEEFMREDYASSIWIALKMRLVSKCFSLDSKWLNVMVSVIGDVCLQYAEGLLLIPDMNVKGQKWIYSPTYLDWVKESKEFITMKFTQLQMRTMLRAHSIVLRDHHHHRGGGNLVDQNLDKLHDQFAQKFAILEAKAEQTVQSAVEDLKELSESVMQLLRHMKTNSKASESSQHELTQREIQTETSEDGGGGPTCDEVVGVGHQSSLMSQESQIAQMRLELEDLREWVTGMYGELSGRISALSIDGGRCLDNKSSSDFWLAHEVNKIKAALEEYVESTRLQLFMLQSSIKDLQRANGHGQGLAERQTRGLAERQTLGLAERQPYTLNPSLGHHLPDRRETTNMQENAHGPDSAVDNNQDYFISEEDAKFGAASPDQALLSALSIDPFNSQNTKSSGFSERCQTRSTDDLVSHAMLTYIRSSVSAAAAEAAEAAAAEAAAAFRPMPRGIRVGLASEETLLDRIDAQSAASDAPSIFIHSSDRPLRLITTGSLFERSKRSVFVADQISITHSHDEEQRPFIILRQEDVQQLQTGILVGVARLLNEQRRKKRVRFSRQLKVITSDLASSSSDSSRGRRPLGSSSLERHTTAQTISRTNWLNSWMQAKNSKTPLKKNEAAAAAAAVPKRSRPRLVLLSRIIKKNVPHKLNWDWGTA